MQKMKFQQVEFTQSAYRTTKVKFLLDIYVESNIVECMYKCNKIVLSGTYIHTSRYISVNLLIIPPLL